MAPMKAISPLILALGPALLEPAPLAAGAAAFEEDTDRDGRPDRAVLARSPPGIWSPVSTKHERPSTDSLGVEWVPASPSPPPEGPRSSRN